MYDTETTLRNEGPRIAGVPTRPLPAIEGAMNGLDNELNRMEEVIALLYSKLAPVLGPEGPTNSSKEGLKEGSNRLSDNINGRASRLAKMVDALSEVNARLEL